MNIFNNKIINIINTIVTSDSDIKKLRINKKQTHLIKFAQLFYIALIVFTVIFSFISFAFKGQEFKNIIITVNVLTFFVLLADYILHWITYPIRSEKTSKIRSLISFPFTGVGLLLLICLLPSLSALQYLHLETNQVYKYFETLTFIRVIRLIFILKIFPPFKILINVFKEQKLILNYVFIFIIILIFVFALIIWKNEVEWLENETLIQTEKWFNMQNITISHTSEEFINKYNEIKDSLSSNVVTNLFDALYFSTITLTTIGYGDFSPHAATSKFIVIVISIIGIAIFTIPSGIVAGSIMNNMSAMVDKKTKKKEKESKNRENK
ncbi:potassium channel family protein [Mycoplasma anserisalpingitidis]|uniref:potassium channel family protein n=1 Tax=Mycoplasma anserisalpingitidis TaxID=519450 RepID=UPI0011B0FC21|nr:potassium channel family protein [Mycoplasma anserisalpingitidis]QDY87414.1 two pore domain potassium channel family protein [Mycoplasma anserisalpingitidis]